jgi:hypothetical protein
MDVHLVAVGCLAWKEWLPERLDWTYLAPRAELYQKSLEQVASSHRTECQRDCEASRLIQEVDLNMMVTQQDERTLTAAAVTCIPWAANLWPE